MFEKWSSCLSYVSDNAGMNRDFKLMKIIFMIHVIWLDFDRILLIEQKNFDDAYGPTPVDVAFTSFHLPIKLSWIYRKLFIEEFQQHYFVCGFLIKRTWTKDENAFEYVYIFKIFKIYNRINADVETSNLLIQNMISERREVNWRINQSHLMKVCLLNQCLSNVWREINIWK
jgi:hypothetical protein